MKYAVDAQKNKKISFLERGKTMSEKICPLMTKPVVYRDGSVGEFAVECVTQRCALWLDHVWTAPEEYKAEGRCALKFMGEKNADGRFPV